VDHEGRDVVVTGGTVRLDEDVVVEALAVRDGRVLAAGSREDVRARVPGAAEVDLDGLVVAPGLVDTHPHLLHFGAWAAPLVDVADARDWAGITGAVAARAASAPPGDWIMTTPVGDAHYFVTRSWRDLAEGALPDAAALDAATTAHPVLIQAWAPVVPNHVALNSAGLAALGIDRDTPDRVAGVTVEKDAAGLPTGRLSGAVTNYYNHDPFWARMWERIPYLQPEAIPGGVLASMAQHSALGTTTVYEGHAMEAEHIGLYRALRGAGALTVRVLAAPEVLGSALPGHVEPDDRALAAALDQALALLDAPHQDDDLLRVRGLTLTPTGPCYNGHLVMRRPYTGPSGEPVSGRWFIPPDLLGRALRAAAARGVRVNLCGGGLGEHDVVLGHLDRMRADGALAGAEGWIFQHAYFLDARQAARYAAHGVRMTVSLGFTHGKGDMIAERLGEDVLADLNPLRRMLDAGIVVGASTDWGPKNGFAAMALAVTHEFGRSGRRNDGPAQRVGRREAYAMWGRRAAEVLGWDGVGDLHPGSHADLVVLDRDPVTCPLEDLPGTRVVATVLGGRTVSGTAPGAAR
jgi:predicted amidohydrolase YtcJ